MLICLRYSPILYENKGRGCALILVQKRTLNNGSSLFKLLTRFKISETFKLRGTPTKYNYRSLREILNVAISTYLWMVKMLLFWIIRSQDL
jgi:hypothetical protein